MFDPIKKTRVGDRVTIYTRGKSLKYVADFWDNGRHQRVSLKTANKKIAIQRAVQLDAALVAGTYKAPPPPTAIHQAVDDYISFLTTEGRARKTIVRYQGELHNFRDFATSHHASRLAQISPTLFDKFRAHCKGLGHGPKTLFHESIVVKQWANWCCRRRMLAENPLSEYKLKKPVLEPRDGPTLEQLDRILGAARGQRLVQYAMLAFTGMRSGECQRLRTEDVDLDGKWINIVSREGTETKSRRSRKVPIHPRLGSMLEKMPRTKGPWFFTAGPSGRYPKGDHWTNPKRLNEDFLKLLEELGLPAGRDSRGFTIHSLRHSFETIAVNAGIPQRVIDTWLGHRSDQSMAAIYYKLSDAESQAFMLKVPFGTGQPAASAGNNFKEES